ncbi:zinc finger, CSL-type containing 3 (predicted), isoform CRA_b [Rattus norvegicus]|uniref:Zinc finger, CSL-type containing 3 (Predicted), isoform CRA_b n=1 Tax=Rattus norvegicus TaxID=10116 RepID=A6HNY1_RAT|nr:zinc finger, CSL-type containing 3 (predicted), isoform CRA_b [Rattus norvegicus]
MEKGISSLFLSLLTETSETRTSYHSDRVRAGGGALQICASITRARLETNSLCTPTSGGKESEFRAPYCRGCKWTPTPVWNVVSRTLCGAREGFSGGSLG